jgi:hypothetical protein
MSSSDSEQWTNNSETFEDIAGDRWPLRDPKLAGRDHIAFGLSLQPIASVGPGIFLTIDGSTVSYDSDGVRHVQTGSDWRTWVDPLREVTAGSLASLHIPSAHINYDALAREELSRQDGDTYEEGGSVLNRELCEGTVRMSHRILELANDFSRSGTSYDYEVLNCIFVFLKDSTHRGTWSDMCGPAGSHTNERRRIRYDYTDLQGSHIVTVQQPGALDDLDDDDQPDGEFLTISVDEAGLKSLVAHVLAASVGKLIRATDSVAPEQRRGRPLSVKACGDLRESLVHFLGQDTEQSEGETATPVRFCYYTKYE